MMGGKGVVNSGQVHFLRDRNGRCMTDYNGKIILPQRRGPMDVSQALQKPKEELMPKARHGDTPDEHPAGAKRRRIAGKTHDQHGAYCDVAVSTPSPARPSPTSTPEKLVPRPRPSSTQLGKGIEKVMVCAGNALVAAAAPPAPTQAVAAAAAAPPAQQAATQMQMATAAPAAPPTQAATQMQMATVAPAAPPAQQAATQMAAAAPATPPVQQAATQMVVAAPAAPPVQQAATQAAQPFQVPRQADGSIDPRDLEIAVKSAVKSLTDQEHMALWNRMTRKTTSRECPPLLKENAKTPIFELFLACGGDVGKMTAVEEITLTNTDAEDTVWAWFTRDDLMKHYYGKTLICYQMSTNTIGTARVTKRTLHWSGQLTGNTALDVKKPPSNAKELVQAYVQYVNEPNQEIAETLSEVTEHARRATDNIATADSMAGGKKRKLPVVPQNIVAELTLAGAAGAVTETEKAGAVTENAGAVTEKAGAVTEKAGAVTENPMTEKASAVTENLGGAEAMAAALAIAHTSAEQLHAAFVWSCEVMLRGVYPDAVIMGLKERLQNSGDADVDFPTFCAVHSPYLNRSERPGAVAGGADEKIRADVASIFKCDPQPQPSSRLPLNPFKVCNLAHAGICESDPVFNGATVGSYNLYVMLGRRSAKVGPRLLRLAVGDVPASVGYHFMCRCFGRGDFCLFARAEQVDVAGAPGAGRHVALAANDDICAVSTSQQVFRRVLLKVSLFSHEPAKEFDWWAARVVEETSFDVPLVARLRQPRKAKVAEGPKAALPFGITCEEDDVKGDEGHDDKDTQGSSDGDGGMADVGAVDGGDGFDAGISSESELDPAAESDQDYASEQTGFNWVFSGAADSEGAPPVPWNAAGLKGYGFAPSNSGLTWARCLDDMGAVFCCATLGQRAPAKRKFKALMKQLKTEKRKTFHLRRSPVMPAVASKGVDPKKPATAKKPVNKWRQNPPQHCESCDQDTHSLDRDAPPGRPVHLAWTKTAADHRLKSGYPLCGRECYKCGDARRSNFHNIPQQQLLDQRKMPPELGERFCCLRKKKVGGESYHESQEKVDVNAYKTHDREEAATEFFREGSWIELWKFVGGHRMRMTKETHTEEQAIQAVLAKYPRYSCDYEEEGVMGVEIEDEHRGIKRFKRGVKKSQDKIKERMHEDLKAKHLRIPVRCGKQPASSVGDPEHVLTPAKRSGSCLGSAACSDVPGQKNKKSKGDDLLMESATAMLAEHKEKFTIDLSCQLSDLAEVLETRHSVLEKIRISFKDVVLGKDTDIQRNQVSQVLSSATAELLLSMMTTEIQKVADESIAKSQRALVLYIVDRFWRAQDVSIIVTLSKVLLSVAPELDNVKLSELNVAADSGEFIEGKWARQAVADLTMIVVGGQVLECHMHSGEQSRELRAKCLMIAEHKDKLSSRRKAFFKTVHGAHAKHGGTALDIIEGVYRAAATRREPATSDLGALAGFAGELRDELQAALKVGWREAGNALIERIDPDDDAGVECLNKLKALGEYSGQLDAQPAEKVTEELTAIGNAVASTLLAMLDGLLEEVQRHSAILGQICDGPPVKQGNDAGDSAGGGPEAVGAAAAADGADIDECALIFNLHCWILGILMHYDTFANQKIKQCNEISDLHAAVINEAPRDLNTDDATRLAFTTWSKYWQMERNIKEGSRVLADDCGNELNAFTQKAAAHKYLFQGCYDEKAGVSPAELIPGMAAGRSIHKASDAAKSIENDIFRGGMVEVVAAMEGLHKAKSEAPDVFTKCNDMDKINAKLECELTSRATWPKAKCESALTAMEQFSSKEHEVVVKAAEVVVQQSGVWHQIAEKALNNMSWFAQDCQRKRDVEHCAAELSAFVECAKPQLANMMAEVMIASAILMYQKALQQKVLDISQSDAPSTSGGADDVGAGAGGSASSASSAPAVGGLKIKKLQKKPAFLLFLRAHAHRADPAALWADAARHTQGYAKQARTIAELQRMGQQAIAFGQAACAALPRAILHGAPLPATCLASSGLGGLVHKPHGALRADDTFRARPYGPRAVRGLVRHLRGSSSERHLGRLRRRVPQHGAAPVQDGESWARPLVPRSPWQQEKGRRNRTVPLLSVDLEAARHAPAPWRQQV
ncbi:unnamed protein product [Prorocentrum cordatum]|uniref:PARP n=1 Tax=Prorocentrum cordatum TaxID=2364126 RepID=A0ABN9UUJ6_9DINO|nr:unnamed protein product [Polarella glacialis]